MSKYIAVAVVGGVTVGAVNYFKNASKKLDPSQHVVIVGGGYGGIKLANQIKGKGSYTLIDQKDAFHHNMASLRAAVVPGFSNKTFIPYEPTFGENFKQGKVEDINLENKNVTLNSGESINYTELVLATGSSGPFPGKCDHSDGNSSKLMQLYEDFALEVKEAKNIVLVGGGAVGVELSGEIAGDYPDKQVTIVHNSDVIVSSALEQSARDQILEKLKAKNVKVVFNEKVANLSEIPLNKFVADGVCVTTSSGKEIAADLVIPCFGVSINNEAYSKSLGDCMNDRGQLKVNDCLQVEGHNDVFAIGDCNDFKVTKLALEAQQQGSKTFDNLVHIGKKEELEPYKSDTFRMVVPIGRDGGVCQNGTKVMGDFLAKMIKAKDVFVKIMWKEMGQSVPKN